MNKISKFIIFTIILGGIVGCSTNSDEWWEIKLINLRNKREIPATLKIAGQNKALISSYRFGNREVRDLSKTTNSLNAKFTLWEEELDLFTSIVGDSIIGSLSGTSDSFRILGKKIDNSTNFSSPSVDYSLSEANLSDVEKDINHRYLIESSDQDSYLRGERIYNSNCINCHGNPENEGSIPTSLKFWSGQFKAGNDPYSMYQTLTRGFLTMPPQVTLTPQEKYDVITYIREEYVATSNRDQYFQVNPGYLSFIPSGSSTGPEAQPYHPWSDMDYGNFFINTYELADSLYGIPRYHSPRPAPYADENYLKNNFAYKGIAVRLDPGPGGVSDGNTWMIFDHDLMRVAGGWTGDGFIDWNGILLNDKHETYPRNIGRLHFETPVGPAWANPATGSFEDPRFTARDGRQFGPLPKSWADYKGLYYYEDKVIISYKVGDASILELPGMEEMAGRTVFTRTLKISSSSKPLKMRVAGDSAGVALKGDGATISQEDGAHMLNIPVNMAINLKLFITNSPMYQLKTLAASSTPEKLSDYTSGGVAHYPQTLQSPIEPGNNEDIFAIDKLNPPFDNPWDSRMKLSGIDFYKDANNAAVCTTDGDVWTITGLTDGSSALGWRRIASGLFQPLGIKIVDEEIYVICRDQLVKLNDLNGDGETDFYESFNHDHQVTDHFHEFAMGLQTDEQGNFYYAKSGRHARESLIPQHGTLIKVSKDGSKSEIIAKGFRAANGVCLNPDGTFIVTDQQGFWNPMNRINWIEGKGKFYGNMWGYDPPKDTSRSAMEPPAVWVDMEYDRSPSELLWVDSKKWGPLNGALLSLSYGYGKIQLVLHEKVNGQRQAGVIDLPGVDFMTGIMRGRFNPDDHELYACGMSAWATNKMIKGGGLYRVRYTGKPLTVPVALSAQSEGVLLEFPNALDEKSINPGSFEVQTWYILRTANYGSKRYDIKTLNVANVVLSSDGKKVKLIIPEIEPIDIMTIDYELIDKQGNKLSGSLQNTIHNLKSTSPVAMVSDN